MIRVTSLRSQPLHRQQLHQPGGDFYDLSAGSVAMRQRALISVPRRIGRKPHSYSRRRLQAASLRLLCIVPQQRNVTCVNGYFMTAYGLKPQCSIGSNTTIGTINHIALWIAHADPVVVTVAADSPLKHCVRKGLLSPFGQAIGEGQSEHIEYAVRSVGKLYSFRSQAVLSCGPVFPVHGIH